MDTVFFRTPLRLRRDRFIRLARPAGVVVTCRRGTLWVTIDGEAADIELEPGQSHTFDGNAPALIGVFDAEGEASLA